MAARKEAPQQDEVTPAGYAGLGIDHDDVALSTLRVVGKGAKILGISDDVRMGDIMVGAGAEDDEAMFVSRNREPGLRFYVLDITTKYSMKYGQEPSGIWTADDPNRPVAAQKLYEVTAFVPEYDTTLPVLYRISGGAAGVARRTLNTVVSKHCIGGMPYELCFELTTKMNPHETGAYPGPVFKLAEPDAGEVAAAAEMFSAFGFGTPARLALPVAGDDAATPGF